MSNTAQRVSLYVELRANREQRDDSYKNYWGFTKALVYIWFGFLWCLYNREGDHFTMFLALAAWVTFCTTIQCVYWSYVFSKTKDLVDFTDFVGVFLLKSIWNSLIAIAGIYLTIFLLNLFTPGHGAARLLFSIILTAGGMACWFVYANFDWLNEDGTCAKLSDKYSLWREICRV